MTTGLVDEFFAGLPFRADAFQRQAIASLANGRSVLVAAPTGAGKTLVADFACHAAIGAGAKAFYTTPIKALSNQKFRDLAATHGEANVGLLTGDRSVNPSAPIVVMTTEVLRNMLLLGSDALDGLRWAILDEVHYLGDWERGGVWEEAIVQLPPSVQVVALSATVSNAEELGDWLAQVRDGCDIVITEQRPVPLRHHYWVNDRIHDTFRTGQHRAKDEREAARQARAGTPNPDILMLERQAEQSLQARGRHARGKRVPRVRMRWPSRGEVVAELADRDWLPAIVFVFSRNGCNKAVEELRNDGVRLTNRAEADEIAAIVDTMLSDIDIEDLAVLDHAGFRSALRQGIAPHHAGLIPAFKEAVEVCFQRGLLKVVYATETLALGINMPARSVVIERLEKWDGAKHTLLTPGQYTQLTGRAGRRGIDRIGRAIVLHQRDVEFRRVAGLVSARSHRLVSTFRPSHNLVVNLLATHSVAESERMLAASFAQYQSNRQVAQDREETERLAERIAGLEAKLRCDRGDWGEYAQLARTVRRRRTEAKRRSERDRRQAVERTLAEARPGDVWVLPWVGRRGLAAVVGARVNRNGIPVVDVVADDRRLLRFGPRDLDVPPLAWRAVTLPAGSPRNSSVRTHVAHALRELPEPPTIEPGPVGGSSIPELDALESHACHECGERADHEQRQRKIDRLRDRLGQAQARIENETGTLVRQFEARVRVLQELGHLDQVPRPTERGQQLARIHSDVDLVIAEVLGRGFLDGLDAAELAGVVAMFVYEPRTDDEVDVGIPTSGLVRALDRVEAVLVEVQHAHGRQGVPLLRELDASFVPAAWRWGRGAHLEDALGDLDLTPGDFVRIVKQVIDVLGQLRAAASPDVAERAGAAVGALRRGIVDL